MGPRSYTFVPGIGLLDNPTETPPLLFGWQPFKHIQVIASMVKFCCPAKRTFLQTSFFKAFRGQQ